MVSYSFKDQPDCLMCGTPSSRNPILGLRLSGRQGWRPRRKTGHAITVRRCHGCGLTYPDPLPIPASIDDHYAIPAESYWTDDYFLIDDDYLSGEIQKAQQLLSIDRASSPFTLKMLDIGAGIGKGMRAHQRAGFDAFGIEPSPTFRQLAMERLGIPDDRLQLASVEEAQWPEDSFDYITFGAVLEHLYDPALSLQKALSWLRPGGVIHAEVPSSDYLLHRLLNGYYRLIGSSFVANLSPMHVPYHLYEFTPKSFEELGRQLGFVVDRHSYHPASARFVPRAIYPFFYRWMRATNSGMQLTVWLRKIVV